MSAKRVREISVFVDESGSYDANESSSEYFLVCMVFHDQDESISAGVAKLNETLISQGLERETCLHCGPLIRRENEFAAMEREERRGLFYKMLSFIHNSPFGYRCFAVDKRYISLVEQIRDSLLRDMKEFLIHESSGFSEYDAIKIYYDNGQDVVKAILREAFDFVSSKVQFVPTVTPQKYRLFQVADFICSIELIARKIVDGKAMSLSEYKFFGGVRPFTRNVLRQIKAKEL